MELNKQEQAVANSEDFDEIKKRYVEAREKERNKIADFLRNKGLTVSKQVNAGKGLSDYTAGGTISPYDLTNWKYVEAKGDGYSVLVSLQAFDHDPSSRGHHILMDRLGICVYEKYDAEQAFQNMHVTDIDLPLTDTKLDELYKEIEELVSANAKS